MVARLSLCYIDWWSNGAEFSYLSVKTLSVWVSLKIFSWIALQPTTAGELGECKLDHLEVFSNI